MVRAAGKRARFPLWSGCGGEQADSMVRHRRCGKHEAESEQSTGNGLTQRRDGEGGDVQVPCAREGKLSEDVDSAILGGPGIFT